MSGALTKWSDRCNPILVKDVRAALRGRSFPITFVIVLTLAVCASLGYVSLANLRGTENEGPGYFMMLAACIGLSVHCIVPFGAMLGMNGEAEENTLEFLQLSGIAGWRIVAGKLGSALLQALLMYSAFAPFVAFAFLLRGVPAETIFGLLLVSSATCMAQCSVGIALGAIARARWARVLLLIVFGFILLQTGPMGIMMFAVVGASGMTAGALPGALGLGLYTVVLVSLTATIGFGTLGAVMLAHREENRSTPIRVATTFVFLVGCAFAAFAPSRDVATVLLVITILCVAPAMFFVTTERETLPRAVAAHLPGWARASSPLSAWLPGGARGVMFVLAHCAALLAVHLVLSALVFRTGALLDAEFMRLFATVLVLIVFLLLPSAVSAPFTARAGGVGLARLAILIFIAGALVAPPILAFITRIDALSEWSIVSRPFDFQGGGSGKPGPWILLATLVSLSLFANLPRILQSISELRTARATPLEKAPERAVA
ncbi:MAG: hypothetical protein JNL28_11190 [Planctomycetes bacterium]|nr:hypothetical protein [Planctomycetota bacterium]